MTFNSECNEISANQPGIKDAVNVTGQVLFQEILEDGTLGEAQRHNMVVTTGKNWIASRCAGASSNVTHAAIGSTATAVAAANTALVTELARVTVDVAGGTVSNNTITFVANFAAGTGTGAVSEAGLFTASTGGTMVARVADGSVIMNKKATSAMKITWVLTIN